MIDLPEPEDPRRYGAQPARWPDGTPRTAPLTCPLCRERYDAHVVAPGTRPDAVPAPGALLVCAYCATPALLVDDAFGWRARALTPAERAETAEQLAPVLEVARRDAPRWQAAARSRRASTR